MATYQNIPITQDFLDKNQNAYYVFPDNVERSGSEIYAFLRNHPRSFGFIAKKFSDNQDGSFYKPEEYSAIFFEELLKLKRIIASNPTKTFYIACMKGPSINKYRIWELLMEHNIVNKLQSFENVVFCW